MKIMPTTSKAFVAIVVATTLIATTGAGPAFGDLEQDLGSPGLTALDTAFTETDAAALLVTGQAALDAIGASITEVAGDHGVSADELVAEFLADPTLAADTNNNILYVDEGAPTPAGGEGQPAGSSSSVLDVQPTLSDAFSLHSNPGAPITLFLDFDGHTTSGTYWNQWSDIEEIVSPPYSLDADYTTFSDEELTGIVVAWRAVAEDFAPFEVNVTTVEPPNEELARDLGDEDTYGIRTVITNDPFSCSCGGLAYVDRFGYDEPTFVFNKSYQSTGETISHELGHALGLTHDGDSNSSYYAGHGGSSDPDSWAPIMGASFFVGYSQWDNGTYPGATNSGSSGNMGRGADDLSVIARPANGVDYRSDDHGSSRTNPTALVGSGELRSSGIIERSDDEDWFSFELTAEDIVDLDLAVDSIRPNLNAALTIHDDAGALLFSSQYQTRGAAIHDVSLDSGNYLVRVTAEGAEHYDTYATLGSYQLTVSGQSAEGTTTETPATDDPTPPPITCAGRVATIVGTWKADTIVGTEGDDVIVSRGGNDTIHTFGGNDIICSGPGHDTVNAGSGDDIVYAGGGRDHVVGGVGDDWLIGGPGNDRLFGLDGNDKLSGLGGDDELSGHDGRDVIRGNGGHDRIYGHAGGDTLLGGSGRDLMYGGQGYDLMKGHGGTDTMNGGPGNDRMYGGFGIDQMDGGRGSDFGDGMSGRDIGVNFETRRRFAN